MSSLKFDTPRLVRQPIGFVDDRGIVKSRPPVTLLSITRMDVAEDMNLRSKPGDGDSEIGAADMTITDTVKNSHRRAMCHKDIDSLRNQIPFRPYFRPASEVERPVTEPRLPRTAPEFETLDFDPVVAEIVCWLADVLGEIFVALTQEMLEGPVVISRDNDLVTVWETVEPREFLMDVLQAACHRQITCVNEDISVRDDWPIFVSIADENEFHRVSFPSFPHHGELVRW